MWLASAISVFHSDATSFSAYVLLRQASKWLRKQYKQYQHAVWLFSHSSVLLLLILTPTCFAYMCSLLVFSWMWECVCERSAKSSAKSRSSRLVNRFQRIPLFLSCVVCLITQSMVMLKSNADITHPCLTPESTGKLCWLLPTLQLKLL